MTTQTKPAGPARQERRSRSLIWVVAVAIVAAIGMLAFMALTGDSTPTVTFDGETVSYDGPATFEAGEHTFTLDASAYEAESSHAFTFSAITDPSMTDAEIMAYQDDAQWTTPPFIGRSKIFWISENAEDRIMEETFELEPDTRYGIFVIERGGGQAYFAATFEVE
jgi:hypothetical protein